MPGQNIEVNLRVFRYYIIRYSMSCWLEEKSEQSEKKDQKTAVLSTTNSLSKPFLFPRKYLRQPHLVKRIRLNGLIFSLVIYWTCLTIRHCHSRHTDRLCTSYTSVLHPTEQDTHLSNDIGDCLMLIWLLHLYSYEPKQKGIEYQRNIDSIF
jgi:hypothetical protein